MPNAIRDYVEAYERASGYVQQIKQATAALDRLKDARQNIVEGLAAIQASDAYTAEIKQAAQALAAELRQAILDFAATL